MDNVKRDAETEREIKREREGRNKRASAVSFQRRKKAIRKRR